MLRTRAGAIRHPVETAMKTATIRLGAALRRASIRLGAALRR
jgi:hypothetical protein